MRKPDAYPEIVDAPDQRSSTFEAPGPDRARHCAHVGSEQWRRAWLTGEVRAMKLFVAAMGASNYTYAEACPSESLSDWIGVHANLFRYLGGVPKFVVCDNLKAAVTNPDRYDPGINRTYAEMASHYGTAILAARQIGRAHV